MYICTPVCIYICIHMDLVFDVLNILYGICHIYLSGIWYKRNLYIERILHVCTWVPISDTKETFPLYAHGYRGILRGICHVYFSGIWHKRDIYLTQKRPISDTKETFPLYAHGKGAFSVASVIYISVASDTKETYIWHKRDLYLTQKRPIHCIHTGIVTLSVASFIYISVTSETKETYI